MRGLRVSGRQQRDHGRLRRKLRGELLEDRRMLAVITVNSTNDDLVADGKITLREAIQASNTNTIADSVEGTQGGSGIDTIRFAPELNGATITLSLGELALTEAATIDATSLSQGLMIDAQQQSRVFNITAATGDFSINGLKLINGRTSGDNTPNNDNTFSGGAVRSGTSGTLFLANSSISGSGTAGDYAQGGGIFAKGPLQLTNSVISGNSTQGNWADGGGVAAGAMALTNSTVSGNSTLGNFADGGGVFGNVSMTGSSVTNNSTQGVSSSGGGIAGSFNCTLTNSTVANNTVAGNNSGGGGIAGDIVTLTNSSVTGNQVAGLYDAYYGNLHTDNNDPTGYGGNTVIVGGGGVLAYFSAQATNSEIDGNATFGATIRNPVASYGLASTGDGGGILSPTITLSSSTVAGNSTHGAGASGGGISDFIHTSNQSGPLTLVNSTISGNTVFGAQGRGGGIEAYHFYSSITDCTITLNQVIGAGGAVGGADLGRPADEFSVLAATVKGSIIAGNSATSIPDLNVGTGQYSLLYSLVGDAAGSVLTEAQTADSHGNLIGSSTGGGAIDPMLGPLAFNGGPTMTHALLTGSRAIDAGDPAAVAGSGGVPQYDQRTQPFSRVVNGDMIVGARIDMGAFELQSIPPAALGDYNGNGVVDAADYVVWRQMLGMTVPANTGADGSGNGSVGPEDLTVWRAHFGQTLGSGAGAATGAAIVDDTVSVASGVSGKSVIARASVDGVTTIASAQAFALMSLGASPPAEVANDAVRDVRAAVIRSTDGDFRNRVDQVLAGWLASLVGVDRRDAVDAIHSGSNQIATDAAAHDVALSDHFLSPFAAVAVL
ncbi:MAG TPA: choice-of-anchor Q domain-containing protein [Lacipirellulaceae bacterium]|nr:choice-of-anchor Q domain-containing protein [Lacipirellulaceae bacterium]